MTKILETISTLQTQERNRNPVAFRRISRQERMDIALEYARGKVGLMQIVRAVKKHYPEIDFDDDTTSTPIYRFLLRGLMDHINKADGREIMPIEGLWYDR